LQVEKLLTQRDAKEAELIALLKLSPQDIWNKDLDEFLAEWEVSLHDSLGADKRRNLLRKTLPSPAPSSPRPRLSLLRHASVPRATTTTLKMTSSP